MQVGLLAGGATQVNLGLLLPKRASLIGTVLRARPLEEKVASPAGSRPRCCRCSTPATSAR